MTGTDVAFIDPPVAPAAAPNDIVPIACRCLFGHACRIEGVPQDYGFRCLGAWNVVFDP